MSRIGFIVAENRMMAVRSAERYYCWQRIGIFRFVTAAKVDVRVIDGIGEFHSLGPLTPLFRGLHFDRRPDTAEFAGLVAAHLAIWGETMPAENGTGIAKDRILDLGDRREVG